jgi:hypothetical protein
MPIKRKSKKAGNMHKRKSKSKIIAKKIKSLKRTINKRKPKKKVQRGGKRKLNDYFKLMNKARKSNAPSFQYKGNMYKQSTTKTGLKIYKKA